jgi:anti-anti-sigma factor
MMSGQPFHVEPTSVDGTSVLRLTGDVDRSAHDALEAAYAGTSGSPVILDFTDTGYINSTGIAVIVGILAKAKATGREIRACGLNNHYRQIFQITRIADFMAIYDTETAAVTAH